MIVVPAVERPEVSVIVVSYGQAALLRQTLEALIGHTPPIYELILVDNDSPDDTGAWLEATVEGATLLRLPRNVGFGAGANRGAMLAKGRYLCFLNSDAVVHTGWLEPLIGRLDSNPWAAAATPRILNVDGTLQEAGSVVGRDGSTLAYGFGDDPDRPAYRFAHVVDYASAVCLLVRRALFTRCGGFDGAYGIGYYEDVDLAFHLAADGPSVVYEPRSTVSHLRHGSSSHDEARSLMLANRKRFVSCWATALADRPPLDDLDRFPNRLLAARDAPSADTVLIVEDRVPHVDRGSGDPRSALLCRQLAELWPRHRITLIAADGTDAERYAPGLWGAGVEVVWAPQDWLGWLEARRFLYSVVIVSRPQNHERFDEALRRTQPQAHRIYDAEALYFRRLERQAQRGQSDDERARLSAEARRMRDVETAAMGAADLVLCVSEEERSLIESLAPGTATRRLAHAVEADPAPAPFEQRSGLLFFGGFMAGPGSPNEDGAIMAVQEVLPLLHALDPSVCLDIVGADPTEVVRALAGPAVRVIGAVEDPREWLRRARVHLAPLRYGAGIKLKLLDSMAAGLPFVTTPIGAEGLGLGRLSHCLVGDSPSELAHLTRVLCANERLWSDVSAELLELAKRFGRDAFRADLAEAMLHVGFPPPEV